MNDLSLGRLRIANPDESSPETPLQPQGSTPSLPAVTPLASPRSLEEEYLEGISHQQQYDYPSELQTSDRLIAGGSLQNGSYPSEQVGQLQYQQNRAREPQARSTIARTYQDQQQAQFPHDPRSSNRPSSMYYTHMPVNPGANGVTRSTSRKRYESNEQGPPMRSTPRLNPEYVEDVGYRSPSSDHLPQRQSSRRIVSDVLRAQRVGTPPTGNGLSGSAQREAGPLPSSEEWKDRGAAVGVKRDVDSSGRPVYKSVKKGVADFNFGQTLGEGSYSTVLAAQDRQTNIEYAIKILDKRHIIKEDKVKYVNIEKEALNRLAEHPGVIRLYYTFQDERSLYFVLDLCSGGELLSTLKQMGTFDEECTRFYSAQILDTIAHMHSRGIIHRDLKPENVLLDDRKYIKITDFGTAKMLKEHVELNTGRKYYDNDTSPYSDRANSFVGTAEYVSPELLNDKNACKASDLWAFGCILFQLLAGRPPFKAANEYLTFQKVQNLQYEFPLEFPAIARDLIEHLLVLDPQQRMPLEDVKKHEFFRGVTWGRPLWLQKAPRLKAYVPPPRATIRLNGNDSNPAIGSSEMGHSVSSTIMPPSSTAKTTRPRAVTELAPPSQLDIEWSSVLTGQNERILKLGNLNVGMAQGPYTPAKEGGNKLAKFFGGNNIRKKPRLVLVTSSGRIILAAPGGDDKKSKSEVNLLLPDAEVTTSTDSKGVTSWIISTKEKHFTFDDIQDTKSEANTTAASARDWLDIVEKAKDKAKAQAQSSQIAKEEAARMGAENVIEDDFPNEAASPPSSSRMLRHKQQSDSDMSKGRKRFSKRQSKSGLQAVF